MVIFDQDGTIYNYDAIASVSMMADSKFEDIWVVIAELITGREAVLAAYNSYDRCLSEFRKYRNALATADNCFRFSEECDE